MTAGSWLSVLITAPVQIEMAFSGANVVDGITPLRPLHLPSFKIVVTRNVNPTDKFRQTDKA
jgi:hypothetical protein